MSQRTQHFFTFWTYVSDYGTLEVGVNLRITHRTAASSCTHSTCTRGQKGRTVALRLVQMVKKDPSKRGALVPNEDENAKYKNFVFALSCLKMQYLQCTNDDDSNGTAFA